MKIKPLYDRVLLKPVENRTTESGIYVPKESTERSLIMTVIEVGAGIEAVKIGDCVLVSKYAGTEVMSGREKFYVVNQYDILACICEEDIKKSNLNDYKAKENL